MPNNREIIINHVAANWNFTSYPGVLPTVERVTVTKPRPFSIKVEKYEITFHCTDIGSQEEMFRVLHLLPFHKALPKMVTAYWHGGRYVNRFEVVVES